MLEFTKVVLAADAAPKSNNWILWVVLGVLIVGMMVMSIIPKKKQQKKAQEMMNSIKVGTKIKTIGGFVGTIKQINNTDNTFVLDLSFDQDGSNLVVIDRSAVYTVMVDGAVQGAVVEQEKAEEVVAQDDMQADTVAKEKKDEKKEKKSSKKKDKNASAESVNSEDVFADQPTIDAIDNAAEIVDVDVDAQIQKKN
ncbi:MAG: preprotein translocase subunit YajC [Clostridia bacterium]